jgi:hypothetical protein
VSVVTWLQDGLLEIKSSIPGRGIDTASLRHRLHTGSQVDPASCPSYLILSTCSVDPVARVSISPSFSVGSQIFGLCNSGTGFNTVVKRKKKQKKTVALVH